MPQGPPPPWVIGKVREMVADGLTVPLIAGQLTALGHPCTPRQVKRWKSAHGVRQIAKVSDASLDAVIRQLRADGVAGPTEGYRWVHSSVEKAIGKKVGETRVRKALLRVAPQDVEGRKRLIERRLIRRVYSADYYLQSGHIDFNCKATLPGGVKLYSYGHVRDETPPYSVCLCTAPHCLLTLTRLHARSLMATPASTWPWRSCL
jgi:hypothetical protein